MKAQLTRYAAAMALLVPATFVFVTPASAAPPMAVVRAQEPQLLSLQIASDGGLHPGALLSFTVEGTPDAQAWVRIADTGIAVGLSETFRGVYTGSYRVRSTDSIDRSSPIRATLRAGGQTVAGNYLFPELFDARFARAEPRMVVPVRSLSRTTSVMGAGPAPER
ncbi:MAG: hypothetical protein ABI907_12530 [Ramlibacter sp.]